MDVNESERPVKYVPLFFGDQRVLNAGSSASYHLADKIFRLPPLMPSNDDQRDSYARNARMRCEAMR